ncbi:SAM-dependent methyltransferase [Bailinhaonella thermotolerans]|uniref:SAM-dependent methyltransferase n=1 Tax=Bailinhaonella thermotolerans TaxID=1070861 RepID=A0A3A4AGB7_9ACTN|nr:SAM-dependent methyltransferase [Bailinhaonella thermotolerans]RJL24713.1 SAM-dependent methyltransferase [Bailinhaonella thermotolerans]
MAAEEFPPAGVDATVPNVARVYDCFLGGKDNFAVDRAVVEASLRIDPDTAKNALANRAFLGRAVRHMAGLGIRQFFDIGSGLPTQNNVHQIAQAVIPDARVVYVDNDPTAAAHGHALLENAETVAFVHGDIRDLDALLDHPKVRRGLDFGEPVGLLLFGILHHLNDDEGPGEIAARLRDVLAPGSHLAISHFHNPGEADPAGAEAARTAEAFFAERFQTGRFRTTGEIRAYFGDFELLDPGLVPLNDWRPDGTEPDLPPRNRPLFAAGVARKPAPSPA